MKKCFSPDLAVSNGLAADRFPETEDEVRQASEVLAKELEKLSLDEHEKILFDVHGITRTEHEEDASSLDAGLIQLEIEVQNIKQDRDAFDLARSMNPAYVDNPKFRIMFLRGESYVAKAAAETLVSHFAAKEHLFGNGEILARDVRLSDLSRWDRGLLELGFTQVLPTRDAAGRTVVAISPEFRKWGTKKEFMRPISRASWYFNMQLMKDEETQRKGTVIIMYNFCGYQEELSFDQGVHHMRCSMPQRVDAAHFCCNDTKLQSLSTGIQLFIDPHSRFRLRSHFGTAEEVEFKLQTFGIPTADSPMQKDGTWSIAYHQEWLQVQQTLEERAEQRQLQEQKRVVTNEKQGLVTKEIVAVDTPVEEEIISLPRKFDVLFGKNKKEREHAGNLRAMLICDMHWEKYEAANKFGKTEVAERILSLIYQSGGRFLKAQRKGGWVEVDDCVARGKIAHFFRFMRSKARTVEPKAGDDFSLATKNIPAKRVTPCASPDHIGAQQAVGLQA